MSYNIEMQLAVTFFSGEAKTKNLRTYLSEEKSVKK